MIVRAALLALALCAGIGPTPAVLRGNGSVAADLLALGFRWEDGRALPRLSRFDGPVRLRVEGGAALRLAARDLLGRLRREAGIDILLADGAAEIVVREVPAEALPAGAACAVRPGEDWGAAPRRLSALVLIPARAPPPVRRDCLHEEVAQALGPVGDLWRLADSAFNDDNVQGPLTAFDMLVLRATYALPVGATREAAAAALPAILARLNPAGERGGLAPPPPPEGWEALVGRALLGRDAEAALAALALGPEGAARGLALAALARATGDAAAWRAAAAAFAQDPRAARHRRLAESEAARLDGAAAPG